MKKVTQEQLLNPTPSQIKYRNRLWAEALIANKRKARWKMKCSKGGRCCLRVAQDVAVEQGLILSADELDAIGAPAIAVSKFFGWRVVRKGSSGMRLYTDAEKNEREAASLNDTQRFKGKTKGLPHKLIAECVLNTYVHPSKPKWSFAL